MQCIFLHSHIYSGVDNALFTLCLLCSFDLVTEYVLILTTFKAQHRLKTLRKWLAITLSWIDSPHCSKVLFVSALGLSFTTAFYTALIHSAIDSIISVSCGIMTGHMMVLRELLKTIGRPGNPDSKVLVRAVDLHVNLMRFSHILYPSYALDRQSRCLLNIELSERRYCWNALVWMFHR